MQKFVIEEFVCVILDSKMEEIGWAEAAMHTLKHSRTVCAAYVEGSLPQPRYPPIYF